MKGLRPVLNWNIVAGCNYRCSYCVQKHLPGIGGPSEAQLTRALATLAALPGSWEVKLSGGEPFLLPQLAKVARSLAEAGHKVSVLTNLSASLDQIEAFIESAGAQLRTFSCSLHREMVEEEAILEKALAVKAWLNRWPKATFVVNAVVVPGQVEASAASRQRFEAAGLKFYPQWMRVEGQPALYPEDDLRLIQEKFGDLLTPAQMNRGSRLKGHLCHAGSRYFIVHPKGEAYACYPAKRWGEGHLGSLFDGSLKLRETPIHCPYELCPCTVPQNRGIVEAEAE